MGNEKIKHTVYIVSGGVGASGEQLVQTVLAQFPSGSIQTTTVPNLRFTEQIDELIERIGNNATLVHTLVDPHLRAYLVIQAQARGVRTIDLMGPLIERLEQTLDQAPLGQPGLYRQLNRPYFDRVAAIDFAMANDDGKNPPGWAQAEIVLVGVSRVSKTPLTLYLSVLGWKVANVPIVVGIPPRPELLQLNRQRVIGLTIAPAQLLLLRQQRQARLGVSGPSAYTNPEKIFEELEQASDLCRRLGFTIIDVSDKPIESTADEVIRLISSRFAIKDRTG
jgi:regulator of PEP synthase PpsR (kinase-PPPase family)